MYTNDRTTYLAYKKMKILRKKDVDRFELLKGEHDTGSNNEKMIKELRT